MFELLEGLSEQAKEKIALGLGQEGIDVMDIKIDAMYINCLLYTSPSPRDLSTSRMPSSA